MDGSATANTAVCLTNPTATCSFVRVLVRATVQRNTRLSFLALEGSDDESDAEATSLGSAAPELLLRSELSFVMSSSVLLPSQSNNYG